MARGAAECTSAQERCARVADARSFQKAEPIDTMSKDVSSKAELAAMRPQALDSDTDCPVQELAS